jgi:hypothetical protein
VKHWLAKKPASGIKPLTESRFRAFPVQLIAMLLVKLAQKSIFDKLLCHYNCQWPQMAAGAWLASSDRRTCIHDDFDQSLLYGLAIDILGSGIDDHPRIGRELASLQHGGGHLEILNVPVQVPKIASSIRTSPSV